VTEINLQKGDNCIKPLGKLRIYLDFKSVRKAFVVISFITF